MPSRNSVNKPKLTANIQHRNQSLARKRADRERKGLLQPARSSDDSKSGKLKSVALDLYFKGAPQGTITSKTLSKKRQQKIERNLKYAERRKLLTDVQAKLEEDMEVEPEAERQSSTIKDALWSAIEDTQSSSNLFQEGQGTTLGGPFFP
ncbi:probable Ribosome biogenesis protein ALB1 [Zygosaccharomyces bailii]|uniref:BN860_05820g1_1 n=1 Tax=Zygosaccharomyces bailii (strain CLIB 213 / ATCC 58445 / CBS 680 / BCRC 21525 / NBRC 1098 / NCYC 1416 / NRRL Y-2227) TaxID=1333698 RepID=A0A8J2T3H9_ZYGB2|nr:BN860_05820g1_1 [Zygosaccharomyces bailii CLIB 213]CDH15521.1 probable Ribosome biogenesis protein ALB1 [Zygosaccharomyces bailii ISA1307]SJM85079.1 probable Ribosome biogenesis protein ALB1 [Zygosaccharomyces bailii]